MVMSRTEAQRAQETADCHGCGLSIRPGGLCHGCSMARHGDAWVQDHTGDTERHYHRVRGGFVLVTKTPEVVRRTGWKGEWDAELYRDGVIRALGEMRDDGADFATRGEARAAALKAAGSIVRISSPSDEAPRRWPVTIDGQPIGFLVYGTNPGSGPARLNGWDFYPSCLGADTYPASLFHVRFCSTPITGTGRRTIENTISRAADTLTGRMWE